MGFRRSGFVLGAALALAMAAAAPATVFSFSCPPSCPVSQAAGRLVLSDLSFDDVSLDLRWAARFEPSGGQLPDGFWLVLNDGPDPGTTRDGLAILYGDGDTGRVSAYVYDRAKGPESFENAGDFIGSFASALRFSDQPDGSRLLELGLNVASINSYSSDPSWKGVSVGPKIGIWAHALSGTQLAFDAIGRVQAFSFVGDTSYDRDERDTSVVPEPGSSSLLALGLLVFSVCARRSSVSRD